MMAADIGHVTQVLFSQVPFYKAFDQEFIFDHKDRYLWFELQWIHQVDSLYWKCVRSSHAIYDFQDWEFRPGWYGDAWTLGREPDYYSELMPRETSTYETQAVFELGYFCLMILLDLLLDIFDVIGIYWLCYSVVL